MAVDGQTKRTRIRGEVLDMIEQLGVGRAIPSERRLADDLGVSRLTVRAALDELVREGLLVRRRGSGTYVREPKIAKELTLSSFSEDMRRRGMTPSSKTLSLSRTSAGARLGRCLRVSPATRVLVAVRLRLADGEPMAIERLHVPDALVPGLRPRDLDQGSFYDLLEHRFGIALADATQVMEPTVTSEEESEALGVPLHSPALLFERTTRDEDRQIVEFAQSTYRGDRYKVVTEVSRREPILLRPGLRAGVGV